MTIKLDTIESKTESTAYYEFVLGPYEGKHRQSDSVIIDMDFFPIVDPVIKKIEGFNQFGPTTLSVQRNRELVIALNQFSKVIRQSVNPTDVYGPYWEEIEKELDIKNWEAAKSEITSMIEELIHWLPKATEKNKEITILGL
jgi:hypothetical protein